MKRIFEKIFEDLNKTNENDLNTASLVAMSKKILRKLQILQVLILFLTIMVCINI